MREYLPLATQSLMAGVFASASFGKLRSREDFGRFVTTVRKLTMREGASTVWIAAAFAALETLTAVLIAVPATARIGFGLASALLTVFIGVVFRAVRGRVFAECGCFGRHGSVMSYPLLLRNAALLAVAVTGAVLASPASPLGPVGHALALAAGIAAASALLRYYDHAVTAVLMRFRPKAET